MQADVVAVEPRRRARQEAKCDDHGIGGDDLLRAGNGLRNAAAARIGRAEARLDELHTLDLLGADDLDGLPVEEKLDALFLAVLVITPRARHVVLVAAVRAGDGLRALA